MNQNVKSTWLTDAVSTLVEDSANLLVLLLVSMLDGRWLTNGKGRKRGVEETRPTTDGVSGFLLPTVLFYFILLSDFFN